MIRVLVVARNAALRRVVIDVLETNGYAAFGSDSVTDARSISAAERPDVAIVDDHLVDGGSAELIRALRKLRAASGRPVLIIAAAPGGAVPTFVRRGAHCTIAKPVSERELLVAMRWLEGVYLSEGSEPEPGRPCSGGKC